MNPNQALWEKGDFTRLAETMRESGAELVAKLGIKKGMKVLDLGCGDGTTAIPAPGGSSLQAFTINRSIPRTITVWDRWPKVPVAPIPDGALAYASKPAKLIRLTLESGPIPL